MLLTLALLAAPGQCPSGQCPGPVARTARYVASVPGRLVAPAVVPVPMTAQNVANPPVIVSGGGKPATGPAVAAAKIVSPRRAYAGRWYLGRLAFAAGGYR